MTFKKTSVLLLTAVILTGACASYPMEQEPAQRSDLTAGTVKARIVKGKTTQAEILQWFGSPNVITKNRSNDEVWNFNKLAFQSVEGGDGWSLILLGGSRAVQSTTTRSFDLIVIFDENDIVKDYSVISAQF